MNKESDGIQAERHGARDRRYRCMSLLEFKTGTLALQLVSRVSKRERSRYQASLTRGAQSKIQMEWIKYANTQRIFFHEVRRLVALCVSCADAQWHES